MLLKGPDNCAVSPAAHAALQCRQRVTTHVTAYDVQLLRDSSRRGAGKQRLLLQGPPMCEAAGMICGRIACACMCALCRVTRGPRSASWCIRGSGCGSRCAPLSGLPSLVCVQAENCSGGCLLRDARHCLPQTSARCSAACCCMFIDSALLQLATRIAPT